LTSRRFGEEGGVTVPSEERLAENEAIFREANERIEARARELEFQERVPFLCECGEPKCREILRLELDEYEAVRRTGTNFFVVPGHESVAGPAGRVTERHDRYVVLEKVGRAGEVAEQRNPRQPSHRR
jgi:hypothetical protein